MKCSKKGHRHVEFAWNEECPVCAGSVPPQEAVGAPSVSTVKIEPEEPESEPESFSGRCGSALASLIPDWAVNDTKGCSCKSMQKQMDKLGVQWVNANREMLINHLVGQKKYLTGPLRLVPDAVARLGAEKLPDKAIKMATP